MSVVTLNQAPNIGTEFKVTVYGFDIFGKLAKAFSDIANEAKRAGMVLDGDWAGLISFLKGLEGRLKDGLTVAQRVVSAMYFEDVRGAWETQQFEPEWDKLSADYLAWKIANKLDRRTLIQTGDALKNLGVISFDRFHVGVGVSVETEDGVAYMAVQEFGTDDGRIPPRPLFGPVLELHYERYADVYARAVNEVFVEGKVFKG